MATPKQIDIISSCGLTIEVADYSSFKGIDHTHSPLPWKYKVTNPTNIVDDTEIKLGEECFSGWISPTSRITIPPMEKKMAGIPKGARSFAFMYPPQALAEIFATVPDPEGTCLKIFACHETINPEAIVSAVILGGYAYFDDDFKCICINALSKKKSGDRIQFSGPYEVDQAACNELYNIDCTQPLRLDTFREVGFDRFVWVRPYAKVRLNPIPMSYKDSDGNFVNYENHHGALLFFRGNGTATAYAVDASEYMKPNGDVGFITEAVDCIKDAAFTHGAARTIHEVKTWGNKIKTMMGKAVDRARLIEDLEDKRTLLHNACHAALGIHVVKKLLLNDDEKVNLSHQDEFGWNPLHYACRFRPSDHELIKLLIDECPEAVMQHDQCGRYPLHIACDSDTSEDVITALLAADFYNKKTVTSKTYKLGLLPLHFACYKGAPESIIKALLDADNQGLTVFAPTKTGKLPLHLVILKKSPASMVKTLLDAGSNLQTPLRNSSLRDSLSNSLRCDSLRNSLDITGNGITPSQNVHIHIQAKGILPLHFACWNNSSSETIKMLLEKDENNTTIDETIGATSSAMVGRGIARDDVVRGSIGRNMNIGSSLLDDRPFPMRFDQCDDDDGGVPGAPDGIVPLHLAMKHGSKDVISLLLQKEIEKEKEAPDGVRLSTLHRRDARGRTPLHIACEYNVDPQIIQLLIELDPLKKTTQYDDDQGFRPLHYACEHKDTSAETINILCDAEEQCIQKAEKDAHSGNITCLSWMKWDNVRVKKRSTRSGDSQRKRTPLYLAVRTGASTEVIERLLQPENFTLKGFDDPAMMDLAGRVKCSTSIRDKVIDKLSERLIFSFIIAELYFNIIALVSFMVGSKMLLGDEMTQTIPKMTQAIPNLLIVCAIFFILRELLQIMSVGSTYIRDLWSLYELVCIILLLITADDMRGGDLSGLTAWTGGFLIGQIIIYLRSTFLAFARFVDGLLTIVQSLIPFLIVSVLLLLIYVYSQWIKGQCQQHDGTGFSSCTHTVLAHLFNFEAPYEPGQTETTESAAFIITFGYIVVIILLNIVIAIVCEAWGTATDRSTLLFWKFRLEKINEVSLEEQLRNNCPILPRVQRIAQYIDRVENISFGNDISWTKAPFNAVREKDHYDKPLEYFDPGLSNKIVQAKSLQADLYWNDMDAEQKQYNLTSFDKFTLILKWLGACTFYLILLILGIPTVGLLWPKNFRSGVLLLGRRNPTS